MTNMPRILALDLAESTGFAEGIICGVPSSGSIMLGGGRSIIEVRCAHLQKWLDAMIQGLQPNVIAIEASVVAQMRGKFQATEAVMKSVYGLLMAARSVAVDAHGFTPVQVRPCARYPNKSLIEVGPQAVRKHFLGRATFPVINDGKRAAALQAEAIGWSVRNFDAADALALFDATCAIVAPSVYSRGHSAKFTGRLPSEFRPSVGKKDPRIKTDGPLFGRSA
jgi:hypothetical protein